MPTTAIYDTLATPFEIKQISQVNINLNESTFCANISTQEEDRFNKCFGRQFYKDLLADKVIYTYSEFGDSIIYAIADVVLWFGNLYICTQATTGTQNPTNNSFWALAPKFNTAAYNTLWKKYLLKIIAAYVISDSVIAQSVENTNQGLVRKTGDYFQPATTSEIGMYNKQLISNAKSTEENMEIFVLENKADYPNFLAVLNCACGDNGSKCKRKLPFGFTF
jgi:hypothetical protein